LTEEKILEHLRNTVGERAAIPKEVIILDEIPLTPVGKIFKPALRWESIRRVYSNALKELGKMVKDINISVKEDKIHGALALIEIKPSQRTSKDDITEKVEELLSLYTISYELILR
jgi:fatty-acyl-CoA synthase